MTANATYLPVRLFYDSPAGFDETTARFNQRVPFLDPAVSAELVIGGQRCDRRGLLSAGESRLPLSFSLKTGSSTDG